MNTFIYTALLLGLPSVLAARQSIDTSMRYRQLQRIEVLSQRAKLLKKDTLSSSLKTQQRLLEIPQNIISISSELLQQQGGLQLKDAARNASGVYFGFNSSLFDHSSSIMMRGFNATTTINGMPRRGNYGALLDDQTLFESVEVVKGPAGFINSVGEASGTININTKTPGNRMLNAEISGGSFGLARIAIDAGTQAKEKGFSFRINAVYQHMGSYLDAIKADKYVIAPVVKYNFSKRTYMLGEYDFIRGETRNGTDITKIRSEADAMHDRLGFNFSAGKGLPAAYHQTQVARLLFNHAFSNSWQVTVQSLYNRAPYSSWNMLSSETFTGVTFQPDGKTDRLAMHAAIGGRTFVSQAFVNGKFNTGILQHAILAGGDFTASRDTLANEFGLYTFPFFSDRIDYTVPRDSVGIINPARTSRFRYNTDYAAAFVYDNIKFNPHWILTLGLRHTWFNSKQTARAVPTRPAKETKISQNAFSPRVALTWIADSSMSAYFLYDQSFVPQSGLKASPDINPETRKPEGVPVDPQRNNNLEVGIKKEWAHGRLLTSIAGFHTIKRNVLIADPQNASLGYKRQVGEQTSDGIEVDVLGNILPVLSVSANYTYVNARITRDTAGSPLIGNKLPGAPQQIINTWVQYSIPLKTNRSLAFSLGQTTLIKRTTYTDKYLPDYTKFDAGICFTTPKYYARLIADNITNKRYISSGDIGRDYPLPDTENYFIIEGEPVNFRITVGIKL
ncbi:MAG TPA: TonB-dependent receptor [Chitinophaga sp.]|uniref:TonB-dependent siderophore receptor n=1 Tax=Chitinophaga sp. TaxID=1869181 RepID=UPI002BE4AAA9|nr:TonB-dependent receptor [Chitinophaga sp.]HVI48742.1 TonB-dependent receptor [Chitinophaga sp.]